VAYYGLVPGYKRSPQGPLSFRLVMENLEWDS